MEGIRMISTKYAELNKWDAIKAIIEDYGMTQKAMEEIFREGFLRGEEYASN